MPKGKMCYDTTMCEVDKPCSECRVWYDGMNPEERARVFDALTDVMSCREESEEIRSVYIRVDIPNDFIEDIVVTALEGGINYWMDGVCLPQDTGCHKGEPLSIRVSKHLLGGKKVTIFIGDEQPKDMGINDLIKGIKMFFIKSGVELDAGNIDANDADVIFQYALFGEVVYG